MSTHRIPFTSLLFVVCLIAPAQAGYDFEPPSLRSLVRYFGIGPGPGYHAVPCPPRARLHYRCATRGFAPMPVESDYFPETASAVRSSSLLAHDPFLPFGGLDSPLLTPTPATEILPSPGEEPTESAPTDAVAPPALPAPPAPPTPPSRPPRSFPIETRHVPVTPQQTPGNSLLEDLIQEQEVKLREIDSMLNELGSPPLSSAPTNQRPPSSPTAGDSWW